MTKILGLDLGTNSIGWAIRDTELDRKQIVDAGVVIFSEGFGVEKGNEYSYAAERTHSRSMRRQYDRRRRRKAKLLSFLSRHDMCPVSREEIELWRRKKKAPLSEAYHNWIASDPYAARAKAASDKVSPLEIGRALYHLAQRRGFLSNRKTQTDDESGKVKTSISELHQAKGENATYGEYFHNLDSHQKRIRKNYTSRKEYEREFHQICNKQQLSNEVKEELYDIIYSQRPLKSQKGNIGTCRYEKSKVRSQKGHPIIEEYNVLTTLANFKIIENSRRRNLTDDEIALLIPIFSEIKSNFKAKKLRLTLEDYHGGDIEINYKDDHTFSSSTTTHILQKYLGDWQRWSNSSLNYQDVWHALIDFEDEENLIEWAKTKLSLDDEQASDFAKETIDSNTSNLSIKAARNINRFLKEGFSVADAVICAKLPDILGANRWEQEGKEIIHDLKSIVDQVKLENDIIYTINSAVTKARSTYDQHMDLSGYQEITDHISKAVQTSNYALGREGEYAEKALALWDSIKEKRGKEAFTKRANLNDAIYAHAMRLGISKEMLDKKLYHPSMDSVYTLNEHNEIIPNPLTPSLKNPAVVRMLHLLRKLIITLNEKGKIDASTQVIIEASRDVNTKNKRAAIERYQREREKENVRIEKEIRKHGHTSSNMARLIRKIKLWEEQDKTCIYCGNSISTNQIYSDDATEIEHTIPRSISFDNSYANTTVAHKKCNDLKGKRIPSEMPNYADIKRVVDKILRPQYITINKQWEKAKKRKASQITDPEARSIAIQKKEYLRILNQYWTDKINTFDMEERPEGFKPSQAKDTQVFIKYTIALLQHYFERPIRANKAKITAEIARAWGLRPEDEEGNTSKDRTEHYHHAVDAALLACSYQWRAGRTMYDALAHHRESAESGRKVPLEEPWVDARSDLHHLHEDIVIYHHYRDNTFKFTKIKERERGEVQRTDDGKVLYKQGRGVRANLHKETYYRATIGENENDMVYSSRKKVTDLTDAQVSKIMDPNIAQLIAEQGGLAEVKKNGLYREVQSVKLKNGKKKSISSFSSVEEFKDLVSEDNHWKQTILNQLQQEGHSDFKKLSVRQWINSVRVKSKMKNPVAIKVHRNVSDQDYRKHVFVQNDENYCLAIYQGLNSKGNLNRGFLMINYLDAIRGYNEDGKDAIVPSQLEVVKRGKSQLLNHHQTLYVGQSVLLFDPADPDINWEDQKGLKKRHYVIKGISQNSEDQSTIKLAHSTISNHTAYTYKDGTFSLLTMEPCRKYGHTSFFGLLGGQDFKIDIDGAISEMA